MCEGKGSRVRFRHTDFKMTLGHSPGVGSKKTQGSGAQRHNPAKEKNVAIEAIN